MAEKSQKDGYVSWLVLPYAFVGQAMSVGFLYCYGLIYPELVTVYNATEAQAAWIGSIGYSICFCVGFITSCLCNRYGCGVIMSVGGMLSGIGILLSSFVSNPQHLFITYSVMTSTGASCLFFSSLLMLPLYFNKRLLVATGLASAGSSVGCIVFSPMINILIINYGLKTAFQYCSVMLVIPFSAVFIIKRKQDRLEKKVILSQYFDRSMLSNFAFILLTMAMSIVLFSYYVPYVYLNKYAQTKNISLNKASLLTPILSISSLFGKVIYGASGQFIRINRFYMFQFALLLLSVSMTLIPLVSTFTHFCIFCMVFGFFDGAMCSLVLVVTSSVVSNQQLDIAFGMMYSITSVFSMTGAPFVGFIVKSTGSYQIAFMVCGGLILLGSLILFALPYLIPKNVYNEKKQEKQALKLPKKISSCKKNELHVGDVSSKVSCVENHIISTKEFNNSEVFYHSQYIEISSSDCQNSFTQIHNEKILPDYEEILTDYDTVMNIDRGVSLLDIRSNSSNSRSQNSLNSMSSEERNGLQTNIIKEIFDSYRNYKDLSKNYSMLSLNMPCAMNYNQEVLLEHAPSIVCV